MEHTPTRLQMPIGSLLSSRNHIIDHKIKTHFYHCFYLCGSYCPCVQLKSEPERGFTKNQIHCARAILLSQLHEERLTGLKGPSLRKGTLVGCVFESHFRPRKAAY